MVIYGSRAVQIKTELSQEVCPNCENQGTTHFVAYRRHAHVFWIPLFPLKKKGYSECSHCKAVLEPNEMPELMRQQFDAFLKDTKGPIWQFAGLVLIAGLIVFGKVQGAKNSEKKLLYLDAPQVNDVYSYSPETGRYTTMKVVKVSDDSLFVSPNSYEINKVTRIYKIDKEENYSNEHIGFSRQEIKKMYEDGDIFDIDRD